jgi:ABC-2 type transport system permease protein
MNFTAVNADVKPVIDTSKKLGDEIESLEDETDALIELSKATITDLEVYVSGGDGELILDDFESDVDSANTDLIKIYNTTDYRVTQLTSNLENLSTNIALLNKKLSDAKSATGSSSDAIEDNIKALSTLKTSIDELKSIIETNNAQINALKVTNAQSIVNPIKTSIKPVSSKSGNLNFIFPYFVILIIVFVGIMLSSSLIIMEKTSKAYFRNFTTPTKDITFVMSIFFTSFIVVALQLTLILGLAYLFLNTALFTNMLLIVVLLLAAISLFTLLGMIIGYMFNSQEAVTMASISVGSALIFLSNLILPLETMSHAIQQIARYNPYVLSSELLKKLTLFNSSIRDVYIDFIIIGAYIVLLFLLTMLIEKASKIQFISKKPITKQLAKRKDQPIERYFKLRNGVLLMSEKDLLEELATMTDKEFELYVNKKKNDFESWLVLNNKNELAEKIGQCETRKQMMAALGASKNRIDPIAAAGIDKVGKDAEVEKDKKKSLDEN